LIDLKPITSMAGYLGSTTVHTTVSRNLTGKPPTVPSGGKLVALMMGDPASSGSLLSFGDEGSEEKRGGVM
jgi:hypothetical protein